MDVDMGVVDVEGDFRCAACLAGSRTRELTKLLAASPREGKMRRVTLALQTFVLGKRERRRRREREREREERRRIKE